MPHQHIKYPVPSADTNNSCMHQERPYKRMLDKMLVASRTPAKEPNQTLPAIWLPCMGMWLAICHDRLVRPCWTAEKHFAGSMLCTEGAGQTVSIVVNTVVRRNVPSSDSTPLQPAG
jgi:hypothetical protein